MKLELILIGLFLFQTAKPFSQSSSVSSEGREMKENKVKFMATQLLAKFEDSTASCSIRRQVKTASVEDLHYIAVYSHKAVYMI